MTYNLGLTTLLADLMTILNPSFAVLEVVTEYLWLPEDSVIPLIEIFSYQEKTNQLQKHKNCNFVENVLDGYVE